MHILKKIFSLDSRVWAASFLNVAAMASQLWTLLSTKNATGVSLTMLIIFICVQLTFAQVGYKAKVWGQFWGMIASAAITTTIAVLTFVY